MKRTLVLVVLALMLAKAVPKEEQDLLSVGAHLDELLSLSELPLKKLLHVKRAFLDSEDEDFFWEGRSGGGGGNESALYEGEGPLQLGAAEAQALVGGGGHSKRPNPLLLGRGQRPKSTRRGGKGGGGGGGGGWWKPKGKGKGSVSSIFQMSITALSFLAFGGYLVCMIVNAVRSNGGVMAMAGMTASNAAAPSPASLVLGGKRPYSYGRRRKRRNHLQEEETSTREATAQIPAFTERSDSVVDDVTEPMHRDDDVNEEAEWGHVPPGRFDDMYRALLMISEGYSLYHSHHHGGIA